MKKTRILALLLALLMLPVGLLAACDPKDPDPDPDPDPTPDPNEKEEIVYDDGSKAGYLMFFNFDSANGGDLNIDIEPYKSFLDNNGNGDGIIYAVDTMQAKDKNSLLISRKDSDVAAKFQVLLEKITELKSTHTLEFDVRVEAGCITDTIRIVGTRMGTNKQTFVNINSDGIYDSANNLVYAYKATDKWINVAVGIDDAAGEYNIYVDGKPVASDIAFSTEYKKWSDGLVDEYAFESDVNKTDFYFYIDNLGIVDGIKPVGYTDPDKIYSDSVEDSLTLFDADAADAKESYFEKVNSVFANSIKTTPYSEGTAKLALGDVYAMLRYNTKTKEFAQITFDYGYEMGKYTEYGAVFGNKAFKADDDNWIYFRSNGALEFTGKLNGEAFSGKYSVEGTEVEPKAIIKWGKDGIRYVTYDLVNSTIAVSETESGAGKVYAEESPATLPFGGKTFGYTTADTRVSFIVYEYLGVADLIIEGEGAVELIGEAYTYENGVLKIGAYQFTYADGKFTYGEETFGILDTWALMDCEKYCVKLANYLSAGAEFQFTLKDFATTWNHTAWDTVKVNIYIPDGMEKYGYGLYFDCGSEGKFEGKYLVKYTKGELLSGWNEIEFKLSEIVSGATASKADFTGTFYLKVSGTVGQMGSAEGNNYTGNAVDGMEIYISDVVFTATREFPMEGPAEGKESCTHSGTLVAVDERVEGGCFDHKYYVLKCSECGATKLDTTKEFVVATGEHTYSEENALTYAPTCTGSGYTYVLCEVCNEEIFLSNIEAVGHDYIKQLDTASNTVNSTCKICGNTSSKPYMDKLLSGAEKLQFLGIDPSTCSNGLVVAKDINDGDFVTTKGGGYATSTGTLKCTTVQTSKGLYGVEIQKLSNTGSGYIEVVHRGSFSGVKSFVVELSLMLGSKGENGKYMAVNILNVHREYPSGGGGAKGQNIAQVTNTGNFATVGKKVSVELSEEKFTNIAMHVNQIKRTVDIYADGIYVGSDVWNVNINVVDGVHELWQTRFHPQDYEGVKGSSLYINDFMFYAAEEPVCVFDLDSSGAVMEKEYSGDVELDDDGSVAVSGNDVQLKLPPYTVTTKYVLDFILKGDFKDGAILTGHKMDEYRFINDCDLLTVKNGYIYYLNTAICEAEEANTENGVRITLETNDKVAKTTVYVNGVAVPGGSIDYPESEVYYRAESSYITAYTFKSDAAENYSVEGLEMYTGALKTDEQ